MKRAGAFFALLLPVLTASAQSLPELFHKAKAQVRGESWAAALDTLERVEAQAREPGNEAAAAQLAGPVAFYRGVCEANLDQLEKAQADFAAFLQLEPGASMDPSMYSKKAIAAYRAAQKAAGPAPAASDSKSSFFSAFQEFKLPPNAAEQVNDFWADGPIAWIMTPEEKRAWELVAAGGEREEFVDRFWEARNPHPGNPDNSYRTAFERRVAFADANFAHAEGSRGSMTDRGRVFVLLGPPNYVGRRPIKSGEDISDPIGNTRQGSYAGSEGVFVGVGGLGRAAPVDATNNWREVWHYRKELLPKNIGYQQVDIDFITRKGYGVSVMQRDQTALATLDAAKAAAAGHEAP